MRLAALSILMCLFTSALRADVPRLHAKHLSTSPVIDGDISDAAWKEADHVSKFTDPITGKEAADVTDVWVGYNHNGMFIAFHCHESQPDKMVGREISPGSEFNGEDAFGVTINPFGSRTENGMSNFIVNLLGTQTEHISGGRSSKREWRGIWKSATKRVVDGWTGEFQIPWQMLTYPHGGGLSMDLNFIRHQARTKVTSMWSNWTQSERAELQGIWEGVNPPATAEKHKVDLLAYAAPEIHDGVSSIRFGGDIRYKLSHSTAALISFSPDFENIENQIAGNEFTRTERYVGDVRPFFTEGSDFFNLSGEFTFGRMFYSDRIGQFDAGARVFGQVRPDLAVGAMVTEKFGTETNSVVRVEKQFNQYTSASAYSTYRSTVNGSTNQAFGGNFDTRSGNLQTGALVATEQNIGERLDSAGAFHASYSCPRWFFYYVYDWIQPDFNPALAYIPWADRKGNFFYTEYNREFRSGAIERINTSSYFPNYENYAHGVQERGFNEDINVTTRSDIRFHMGWNRELYANGQDDVKGFGITPNASNRFRQFSIYYETGQRADLPSQYLSLNATLRVLKHLDLSASRSVLTYNGTDSQTVLAAGYEFGPTTSFTTRFVSANGNSNVFASFRKGGGTGTEYYLILGDPNATRTATRVTVKVVWAF